MSSAQAQGSTSVSRSWTQLFDMLSKDQRAGQSELIRQMFQELDNVRAREYDAYVGLSDRDRAARAVLGRH